LRPLCVAPVQKLVRPVRPSAESTMPNTAVVAQNLAAVALKNADPWPPDRSKFPGVELRGQAELDLAQSVFANGRSTHRVVVFADHVEVCANVVRRCWVSLVRSGELGPFNESDFADPCAPPSYGHKTPQGRTNQPYWSRERALDSAGTRASSLTGRTLRLVRLTDPFGRRLRERTHARSLPEIARLASAKVRGARSAKPKARSG
jgi:hypothetical protein